MVVEHAGKGPVFNQELKKSVMDEDTKEFTKKVNQLLTQGWEPAGGINIINNGGSNWYYYTQALIKK